MSKFVLLYHGGKMPANDEEKDIMMAAWGKWMESCGEALVDAGNPFAPPKSIGGQTGDPANGFSILEVESTDRAMELLRDHPMANEDGARIDVHEALSM